MDWLIITEDEDKAGAFRRAMPEAVCISTHGLNWDVEVIIQGSILYQKNPKQKEREKHEKAIRRIEEASLNADRILLAFDPDTMGEACAYEYELLLGREKCARWPAPSLDETTIRNAIGQMETLQEHELPKSNKGLAESYWVQETIDIAWTANLTTWIRTKTSREEKITRLMGALLRAISEEQRLQSIYVPRTYWEMKCRVRIPGGEMATQTANAVVPTYTQMGDESTPKTRDIWKKRMQEAKRASSEGYGQPQPEAGKPWKFNSLEEISAYKNHLEKFPYFIVDSIGPMPPKNPRRPPLTGAAAAELAVATEKATPEQAAKCLQELYHLGWITHPKTTNPNLSKKCVEELVVYGNKMGMAIEKGTRNIGEPPEGTRWIEAIRPTRWERTPEKTVAILPEGENRIRQLWFYRMIYQRALESQLELGEEKTKRCYLRGPLYLRRRAVRAHGRKEFQADRETRLGAHMNLILGLEWEEPLPNPGDIIECHVVEAYEKKTTGPEALTSERLLGKMTEKRLGKRKSLLEAMNYLQRQGCIDTSAEVRLTPKGSSLGTLLNNHFGAYFDENYHHGITEDMQKIENREADAQIFLQEWWQCLSTYLEEEG